MPDFRFTPVPWSHKTNIYEINLRQYTYEGTFMAFTEHLPRLKDMGVATLWFMPLTPIAVEKRLGTLGSYYACADYTSINPEFGTLEDFKSFVVTAHDMGFKVIIDWVANHTGFGHTWTITNPEYYLRGEDGGFIMKHGWEDVIHLDYDNDGLRKSMIEAMRFWLTQFNIDGFRCDMAHLVPLDFWQEARLSLDSAKKIFWLAECEAPNYHEVFDATYSWKLLHTLESFWKKETGIAGIDETFYWYKNEFPATGFKLLFTSNHDENSHSGSEYERLGAAAKAFAVLTCTWAGMPLIYSGQEAANTKRIKFFDKDFIDWKAGFPLQDFYKKLLHLHSHNAALRGGDEATTTARLTTDSNDKLYGYLRKNGNAEVLVLLNLSADYYWAELTDERAGGDFVNLFTNEPNDITKNRHFEMHPWNFYVYEKKGVE
ncbi:MAG: alpha-amylase family glycosyl hydrolase [Chitinophagaceae bacterium]